MRRKDLCRSIGFKATASRLAFADKASYFLRDIFPSDACHAAAATTTFEMRGKHANGNDYGLGVYTNAQTYGYAPDGCGGASQPAVQLFRNGRIQLTDDDAADVILGCFGLSVIDLMGYFTHPGKHERYTVSLQDVVESIAPELLSD